MQLIHDPAARLDYGFDWGVTDYLGQTWLDGDTIATAAVTSTDAALVIEDVTHDATTVTCWVSGGTPGFSPLTCHITTTAGRQDKRTRWLQIEDR